MRRASFTLALAVTGVLALPCTPASAQSYSEHHSGAQVDVGIFYDGLSPYGDWVEMPDYGWSFAPRVERGWRPYTRGQWIMTDDGWYWDSDERFGWAAYHYGRWVNDRYYGWVWVPGTEWAPAWVSWRHGNGYTGWAPLPPRATWQSHIGLNIGGLEIDAFIGANDYAFVQDRAFVDRGIYQQVLPPVQNVTIINVTNNVTNYTVVNQRVVDNGIPVANVERAVGRSVPRARTVEVVQADALRSAPAGQVAVYRPAVTAAPAKRPAQGRSLVKGEAAPPLLVERRKAREQELQQKGSAPVVTAKDVQERRPAAQPQNTKQETVGQPPVPRTDTRAQQQADQQREKQANDANAKAQADKHATDAQQVQRQNDQRQANQQQADQQRAKEANDANAKAQADKRATDDQQAQRQNDQRQAHQQQADRQRAKQANDANAKANADKGATDAQQEQRQNDQRQANQQQVDQQRAKQANDANAKAQADKRATDAQQAQKPNDQGQANQQQAAQQRAKAARQQAKDDANGKDKGKKEPKASPAPPPAGE